jgi:hypothetical protein
MLHLVATARPKAARVGGVVTATDTQRVDRHEPLDINDDLFTLRRLMVSSAFDGARASQAMPLTVSMP